MTAQANHGASHSMPDARLLLDLATGFMRAKQLFVAGELGVFERLGECPATLEELAANIGSPVRTTRVVVDAVTALGLLERHGSQYRNSE